MRYSISSMSWAGCTETLRTFEKKGTRIVCVIACEWAETVVDVDPLTVYECKTARQGTTYRLKTGEMLNASDPRLGIEDTSCSWSGLYEWLKLVKKSGHEVWGHENILAETSLSLPHWEDYSPSEMWDYMEEKGWTFCGDAQWYREWVLTEVLDEPGPLQVPISKASNRGKISSKGKRHNTQKTSAAKKK